MKAFARPHRHETMAWKSRLCVMATALFVTVAPLAFGQTTVLGNLQVSAGAVNEDWSAPAAVQSGATPRTVLGVLHITVKAQGVSCAQGNECFSSSTGVNACADGYCCDASCGDICDACNLAGSLGACTPSPSTVICRATPAGQSSYCNPPEYCNGASATFCPADTTRPAGSLCDDSNCATHSDVCNSSFVCTSTAKVCPASTACETYTNNCDGNAQCSVTYAAPGVACSDGRACTTADACNGLGRCVGTDPVP